MTRNSRRVLLLTGIFGLSLLSCGREVTGPGDGLPFGMGRVAALAIDPQFPSLPGTNLASDIVPFVTVRVTLRGLDGVVVKDTVVDFPSDADSVALTLDVPLPFTAPDSGVALTLAMAFVNAAGDTVFRGGPAAIRARPAGTTAANVPIVIPVAWVPPGAVPASVVMTPTTGTVVAGTTTVFSATAFDGGGAAIPGTPIDFTADTPTRASFAAPGNGTVTWLPNRGNVRIIASTLNLRADTSFFVVSLPASRLLAVSGGAQSAVIGTALAQPLLFRVTASDSVPVSGMPVTFAVTTGGGTLIALADTSDATGLVSTSWTLGALVGAQSVTATATGIAGATQVVTATGLAPLPTQLAITASPTAATAGAPLAPIVVEVRDANNALTPLFTGPVTLALNAGATGATLGGTATVNALAGIATFAGLSIQRAAAGLTLSATSGALTPATSAAFAVAPAAPATLVAFAGDAQSGTLGQPLADSLTVELRDAFTNPIPGSSIAFSVTTGGGSVTPATAVTDANGRARASWTLGALVGAQAARAQLVGAPAIFREFTATGAPGTPVRLEIVGEPSATQVAGAPFAPAIVVRAVDAVGATVTAFTGPIALALATNPSAATPTGTLSTAAVAGIATFSNVVLATTGVGYTFAATSGLLLPDTTIAVTVLNAAAAQLTLVSGNAQSGAVITALAAPFVVRVVDGFGNGVSGFAVDWAITSAGGALSATTTATGAGGFASTTLTLPSVAGTATVQATAGGLTGSPQLFTATATAGTASQLAFALNTGAGIAGTPITPGWVIQARDGLGNVVPSFTGAITVVLTNGPPTAVLGGTTTVNAVAGVATFADLTVNLGSSSWVLAATAPGLAGANSAALSIGAAAPTQIALLGGGAQTAAVLAPLTDSIAFRVTDQFGNFAAGAPVTVAITVGGGSVSPVGGVTDAAGRFATAWTLGALLGAQSITATITTAPTAQAVATATATPGAAVALALVNTIGSQVSGATIPDLVVEARDASGNVATTFNGVVNGRVLTGPNGPDTDSVSVTAVNGVATFSGQTFEAAGDYTLRFNAVGLTDVIHPTITVTPGAAANIAVVAGNAQTGSVSATLTDSVTFRVTDTFGNGVPATLVGLAVTTGGGVLAPTTGSTNAAGILRTAWTLGSSLGLQSITATVTATPAVQVVATATAIAGAATQLVITSTPLGPQVAGVAFPDVVVQARDAAGNVATGFNGIVRAYVDIASVPFDSAAATAIGGVATFSGAFLEAAGTYSLRFTAPGLTNAIGSAFVVTPAAAAILGPDGANSGDGQTAAILTTLANPLRALLTDAYLNPIAGVTVLFTATRGIDTLGVDTVVTNAQGIAAITPTMPETAGPIAYLVSTAGLTGFTFNITAAVGAAATLTLDASPTGGSVDAPIGATGVTARDIGGNTVLAFTGNVTVTIDSGTVGALMAGSLTRAAVAGVASFTDLRIDRPGNYRLRFTSLGLGDEITTTFTMTVGAPASVAAIQGSGQTGGASQQLPDSIGARVADQFGNPIAGATVVWTVEAGGGSLAVASGTTDAGGIMRNAWTLGANVGTQSVSAQASGLTQALFTATATVIEANVVWTGATSAAWSVASNWSGGSVPSATDSVRIPAGTPFSPALDTQASVVGRLRVQTGATLVLDTFPLFVAGTLDVEAGAAVLSDSLGGFALIGNGTVRGAMPQLFVQSGAYALNGALSLTRDLAITGGSLAIGTFAANVGGTLSTVGTGQLVMTAAPGSLDVAGDAIFSGGSTAGLLTAGVLSVQGDFLQAGGAAAAFSASGTHVAELNGTVMQTVTLLNADAAFSPTCGTGSCFATLRSFKGTGEGAIEFGSDAKALTRMQFTGDSVYAPGQTLVSAGAPDFQTAVTVAGVIGWQTALTRGASFQVDTLVAWGTSQTLIISETIPTRVLGEYQLVGAHPGAIIVDGGAGVLDVTGAVSVGSGTGLALVTRGSGRVRMAQTTDTLSVLGDAEFGGATVAGEMTNGVLELAGNFVMSNETADAFIAGGAHVTRFIGASPTAAFSRIGANRFADLEINSASGFSFVGNATVGGDVVLGPTTTVVGGGLITIGGDLIDAVGTRWQATETFFQAADPVIPPQFTGSAVFLNGVVMDTTMVIGGNLEIRAGLLDMNGQRVDVAGQFEARTTGALRMVNAADTLVVGGTATFRGASSAGQLTAGYLELRGGFAQFGTGGAFRAGPAHETWFTGALAANVSFATPGFGSDSSHFGTLYLSQPSGTSSFALASDVYVNGLLENGAVAAGSDITGGGQRIVSRGAEFSNLRFSNVRWQLVDGAAVTQVDSLSFLGMDPTAVAFEIARAGGAIAIPYLTFAGYVPTAPGRYLRVEDVDGPTANGTLTVNVTTPTPTTHDGFLEVVNGAVVNGWTDFAGLNWTGAVSTDWTVAGNWTENRIPSPTDSVFFGAGVAQMPVIAAPLTVRALVNDNANPVTMTGGNGLFVQERLVLRPDTDGLVCDGGSVDLTPVSAAGVVPAQGRLRCNVTVSQGRVVLSDSLVVVDSTVSVQGTARIVPNGRRLRTLGSLLVSGTGSFEMTGATDTVIAREASFTGSATAGTMTAGELRLSGSLSSGAGAGAFAPSGTHRTTFVSGVIPTANISFADPATATFARLEVQRPVSVQSRARVAADLLLYYGGAIGGPGRLEIAGDFVGTSSTNVTITALEIGGVFADTGSYQADTTVFTGTGQVLPFAVGSAVPDYQTVRVSGTATVTTGVGASFIDGDLLIDGGTLSLSSATAMNIGTRRDLRVTNGGRLLSLNAAHAIGVLRDALFDGGSADGDLATGQMTVVRHFTQLATTAANSFRPAPAYTVYFDSSGTVSFADAVQSRFGRLQMFNPDVSRTLLTDVLVADAIYLNSENGVVASALLGAGGTRTISAGIVYSYADLGFTLRNVALRAREIFQFNTSILRFDDFDPSVVQLDLRADNGLSELGIVQFLTTPTGAGRYLRVEDTDLPDGLNYTVNVTGAPTPSFHGGRAEVIAPAVLNGWLANPNFTWTGGAGTNLWGVASNWAGNAVPGAADSVFVPGGLSVNPVVPAAITLRAFVSARTASPISLAGSLTITERLHVPTVGGIFCTSGTVEFTNAVTPMTASGLMPCFVRVLAGTLIATDTLDVGPGDIQVEGTAILDAGSDLIAVGGQFSTLAGAQLRMQDDSAHVRLANSGNFGGGSTAGLLTAGRLEIGGNFTQNGNAESFSASGTHVTAFTGSVTQGVDFADPGANAGSSHFANLEIGQPAGITSVLLATDAFAIGQLRGGAGPRRFVSAITPMTLTSHGAAVNGFAFDNVRWQLRDGAPVDLLTSFSFSGMAATLSQFDVERASGTVTAANITFNTVPTTGAYVRVADANGATGGNFTLSMSGTNPSFHSGAVQVIAPAVLAGWAENPGFTWTGATSNAWLTASNWSDGVVPTGADSVHIPTGLATYPVLGADTAVRVLTMDAGATLGHGGSDLTVRGSLDMAPTAAVTASSGVVRLTGSGAQTVRGSFNRLYLDGGDYALTGPVLTSGNVEVYNGDLSVGNFDLTIGGGILTGIGSTFTMTGTGTVDVASYVNFFGNSTAGRLTNGILRVRGDFEQLSGGGPEDLSFSASGNHVVELAGVGRQRVRFDSPDTTINGSCATSCFATLRSVQAPGTGWVEFSNGVKLLGDLDLQSDSVVALGTPAVGVRLVVAGTARFDTPVLRAGLIAWRDSVAQNASTALEVDSLVAWGSDTLLVGMPGVRTVVTGSYRLRGTIASSVDVRGALAIQGATRVIGNFSTSAGGTIAMSLLGDTLAVDSTATFGGGSTAGLLAGGAVRVGGNFLTTSSAAYAASGTHGTVLYNGCGLCDGFFIGLSDTLSSFRDLAIQSGSWTVNPPSAEVHILDDLSLLGTARLAGTPLVRVGNDVTGDLGTNLASIRLSVAGAFDFAGTYAVDTLILAGASQVLTRVDPLGNPRNYNNVRVTGTATVVDDAIDGAQVLARLIVDGGTLRVGTVLSTDSARVFVNGVFETINGGVLEMRTPLGRMGTGNATFGGGSTAGLITAGLLSINGGDFTQTGDPASFSASGTHETRFSNEGAQQVTFANPGSTGATSRFQHLRISQTEGSGLELLSDVVAAGQLRESMSAPAFVTAPIGTPFALTTGGARVVGIEFTRVRWVLGDGAPVDSTVAIRFNAMPDDVTQFDIIRGGGTVALATLDFLTPPSTGLYLRATDGDVGNGIPLVVAVTSPTPTSHGGAIAVAGGATITGWPQDPPLQAIVWTGAVSSLWSSIGNWDLGRLPIATDSVYINGSVLNGAGNPYTVAVNVSTSVAKLIVGPAAALTLNHTLGQTLTVDSLSSMPAGTTFNLTNGSVLAGAGTVDFGGFLDWNGGTLAGSGIMNVQASATADIATTAAVTLNGRTLSIGGTATIGEFDFNEANSPTLATQVGGELTFAAPKSLLLGSAPSIVNAGTLRISPAGTTVRIDWPISNTGTIDVASGVLDLRNTLTHSSGTVSILANATLVNGGSTVASAAVAISDGGRLTLQSGGSHVFSPTSSVTGLGTFNVNAAGTVVVQGEFDVDSLLLQNALLEFNGADTAFVTRGEYTGGGWLRGTGVLAIRGAFTSLTGNVEGTGTISVLSTGSLNWGSPLRGWTLDVAGTLIWGDRSLSLEAYLAQNARINILAGGLLDIQHGATSRDMFANASNPMTNAGTIRKLTGTGTALIRTTLANTGAINGAAGTISFQFGCTNTGTIVGSVTGTGCTP